MLKLRKNSGDFVRKGNKSVIITIFRNRYTVRRFTDIVLIIEKIAVRLMLTSSFSILSQE